MICSTNNPAQQRLLYRFAAVTLLYAALLVPTVVIFVRYRPAGLMAYGLAVLPALPILGMLLIVAMYLVEEKDEFIRSLQIQSLLGGMGGTLALVSVWGFLENFTNVRHLDLFWVYPIFWGFVGISAFVVRMRNR
ncbi:MAG: hypothetical protein ABR905_16790 [Terracidiphilus sp.]|jgi:hypothetical protein